MGQVVDAADGFDLIVLVQFPDVFAVVVGHQPFALAAGQRVPQPRVILPAEFHCVVTYCFEVRRVTIKKGVVPVVLTDQRLEVLVLDHRVFEPAAPRPDEVEGFADVEGLAAIGSAAAAVAVADELEESGGPLDVIHDGVLHEDGLDFLELWPAQVLLGQLQFLPQVFAGEFLLFKIFFQDVEFVPAV